MKYKVMIVEDQTMPRELFELRIQASEHFEVALSIDNAALADVRQMFNDIWSGAGGANTRTSLLALWKRSALLGEKIFATGTGSDASPATLTYEGNLSYVDVMAARNS